MFQFLLPGVTKEALEISGAHQGMVMGRPTYDVTMEQSKAGLRKLCKQCISTMTDLDLRPGPYREGRMHAWAYFKSAKDAAANLHGRKPPYIGSNRLFARHIMTISFTLSHVKHLAIAPARRVRLRQRCARDSLLVAKKGGGAYSQLRLCGEDMHQLGQLKAELVARAHPERRTRPRTARLHGTTSSQPPLALRSSTMVRNSFIGATTEVDALRRTIRMFDSSLYRGSMHNNIFEKLGEISARQ